MARLPIPGSDAGEWGNILNEYLSTSHRPDGTLKNGVVQEANISASAKASLQGMQASTYDPNDVQADVYDRANHTGTQPASSVSGLATVATSGSYTDLSNQPTIPTKTSDLTNDDGFISSGDIPVTSVNTRTGAVTGLAEASDLTAHTSNTSNPHSVTKAQVGLGNVDNTSDLNKPVSTATQSALDGKQATLVSGTNIKTLNSNSLLGSGNIALTKADVGLSNVDNTSDATKNSAVATLTNKNLTSGTNTFPTFNQSTTGNAGSATKLQTARTIAGVPFDGTADIAIRSANITDDEYTTGTTPSLQQARFDILRGDRTAFLPADQIIIEQSTDAGATWTDAGVSDSNKRMLFTGQRPPIYIPLKDGVRNTDCMTRITITAMKYNVPGGTAETDKYNYWNSNYVLSTERRCTIQAGWVWLNSVADRIHMKYETATGANPNSWVTYRSAFMRGWADDNYFSIPNPSFGGSISQTGNFWNHRLTFRTCTTSNDFDNGKLSPSYSGDRQNIQHVKTVGKSIWTIPNNYAYNDHLYSWDSAQNATFPASIKSTASFIDIGDTRIVNGTGSPEGAVSAKVGSIYLDRNATNGITEWRKATGSSTTGWVPNSLSTTVPASASATGVKGQYAQDSDYLYVCVATNTWKRVGLSSW